MIVLHQLPKITQRKKRRLGQGSGTGRGTTAGRGTKGQKARGKVPMSEIALFKHLPLRKGKYRNKPIKGKPVIVNVKLLNLLPKNSIVDKDMLVSYRIIDAVQAKKYRVKILGNGELSLPLVVKLPCSSGAAKKIKSAGGKIETVKKATKLE